MWVKRRYARWLRGLREKGRLLPASKPASLAMHPQDPEQDSAMYYEGAALVETLLEAEGVEKLRKSVSEAESSTPRERFMKVYGSNWKRFDNLINRWIDENAEPPQLDDGGENREEASPVRERSSSEAPRPSYIPPEAFAT